MEAGFGDNPDRLAELEDDRLLNLVDRLKRPESSDRQNHQGEAGNTNEFRAHHPSPWLLLVELDGTVVLGVPVLRFCTSGKGR